MSSRISIAYILRKTNNLFIILIDILCLYSLKGIYVRVKNAAKLFC